MKRIFAIVLLISFSQTSQAKTNDSLFLAVSQGIATPAVTSPINYSHGFTYVNPAVATDYDGVQLSLEYDKTEDESNNNNNNNNNAEGYGIELGVGSGDVGLGIGHYKNDCDNCEGRTGAIAGFSTDSFALGIGYHEENDYSFGMLFGKGQGHRFGLVVDLYDDEDDDDSDVTSYGLGYGYVANNFIFSLDASKKAHKNENSEDDVIMVTPGLLVQSENVALSVSHDTYVNDEAETHDDQVWFGAGFKWDSGSLSVYHEYVREWAVVLAFNF